jgi:hypothetical protein
LSQASKLASLSRRCRAPGCHKTAEQHQSSRDKRLPMAAAIVQRLERKCPALGRVGLGVQPACEQPPPEVAFGDEIVSADQQQDIGRETAYFRNA